MFSFAERVGKRYGARGWSAVFIICAELTIARGIRRCMIDITGTSGVWLTIEDLLFDISVLD